MQKAELLGNYCLSDLIRWFKEKAVILKIILNNKLKQYVKR
mgnify:CR=1 FL=1